MTREDLSAKVPQVGYLFRKTALMFFRKDVEGGGVLSLQSRTGLHMHSSPSMIQKFITRFGCLLAAATMIGNPWLHAQGTEGIDKTKALGDTENADKQETKGWVRRTDKDIEKWRDNRIGMFIHFGVYSMLGGEWKGKSIAGAAEWIRGSTDKEEYDALYKGFNPEKFSAEEWVGMAKTLGARYITITTKHHDGFCLWPSKYTEYNIGNTPFKRDIIGELCAEAKKQGIDMYLYYSIIDWNQKDFMAKLPATDEEKARYARYIEFMRNQCTELLERYPDTKGMWFDGRWDPAYKQQPWIGKEMEEYLRKIKPGIVLGDRVRAYDSFADYNSGYERKLPVRRPPVDWEACMTLSEGTWGYHKSWVGHGIKTPANIVRWISHTIGMGGNMVVNIGPRGDGSLNPDETIRLKEVGRWVHSYADAIYGTDGLAIDEQLTAKAGGMRVGPGEGPFAATDGKKVHVILNTWPETNRLKVKGIQGKVAGGEIRQQDGSGKKVVVTQKDDEITVTLPMDAPDPLASVLTFTLE